jgi:hypothetical protein
VNCRCIEHDTGLISRSLCGNDIDEDKGTLAMCALRSLSGLSVAFVALVLSACGGGGGGEHGNTPAPNKPATFTVGGSIMGLTGTGVLNAADVYGVGLQLNDGPTLRVFLPSPTTFTFPPDSALPDGASYTVKIVDQPFMQVCGPEVANGTGTINGANVTNVAITCADYSFAGAVQGLTASGLILQLNDLDTLTVPSGSTTFRFPEGVDLGNDNEYSISIRTQPAGQTCTIVNAWGSVTAAAPNVTSPSVTCVDNGSGGPSGPGFTVGGSITGLTGSDLQLRLNGSHDIAFNIRLASGATSFAFAAKLPTGAAYEVKVANIPVNPLQNCHISNGAGTVGTSNIADISVDCEVLEPITVGGTVTGLTAAGLALRLRQVNTSTGVVTVADLPIESGADHFVFPGTIPPLDEFTAGILTQPTGQTCTITRAKALAFDADITNLSVACVNNATGPLSGTYSLLDDSGRSYFNFNADGTFTAATIHNSAFDHSDPGQCNVGEDVREGNGVEYGVFGWTASTGRFRLPAPATIDTNGSCGLSSPIGTLFDGNITRVGNTIEIRQTSGGPVLATATAVESDPQSLVGAFVSEINDGELLVFHADGTFLWTELQSNFMSTLDYGQERGCYAIEGSLVWVSVATGCEPDGFAAYDLNGSFGFFNTTRTTVGMPFTIVDTETIEFRGEVFKRTHPN